MKICYVTDRKALAASGGEQTRMLLEKIESAARAGVDWIQIREKDLSGRELVALVSEAVRRAPVSCRILVNDRLDVALAAGAGGVHLGGQSIPVEEVKRFLREKNVSAEFLVGVSTHSIEAAVAAETSGADYIIFGPVFETPSKAAFGAPQGLEKLREVCDRVRIPVVAIGGLTKANFAECITAGGEGIAAIRLFQDEPNLSALLQTLRT
ncbi:MAG TPA: thiamine phosphate synthase [Candidatus Eremiobacteraceae bacterium]|nr:thiamine phosphate synthase [Candidatus Eremiobacteraceae bacterium]